MWNEGKRDRLESMKTDRNPPFFHTVSGPNGTDDLWKRLELMQLNCTCAVPDFLSLETWYCRIGRSCRTGCCHTVTGWPNRSMKGSGATEIPGTLPWSPKCDSCSFMSAFPVLCTFTLWPILCWSHIGKTTVGSIVTKSPHFVFPNWCFLRCWNKLFVLEFLSWV